MSVFFFLAAKRVWKLWLRVLGFSNRYPWDLDVSSRGPFTGIGECFPVIWEDVTSTLPHLELTSET